MRTTIPPWCARGLFLCAALLAAGCSASMGDPGSMMGAGGTTPAGGAGGGPGAGGGAGTGTGAGGAAGTGTGAGGAAGAPSTREYWVSTAGVDTNPGTMDQPFKTVGRGLNVAAPGTTIWIMPGTYPMAATASLRTVATAATPIRIWASGARPLLDLSTQPRGSSFRGFEVSGNYYHLRGLEIANAGDNGILVSGSYNTVEDIVAHGNEDTGIQITVSEASATNDALGANNLILNCDSYGNLDTATNGENADGFAAKLRIGPGNVFRGCRAWNNADDGYDLFAADDVVVIDRCWAFLNGRVTTGNNSAGDGNGFKLGGAPAGVGQGGAVHQVTGDSAFDNRTCGFVRNNNPDVPALSNCSVHGNRDDFCNLNCSPEKTISTTGDMAKTLPRNADGSLPTLN